MCFSLTFALTERWNSRNWHLFLFSPLNGWLYVLLPVAPSFPIFFLSTGVSRNDDGRLIAGRADSAQAPWSMTLTFRASFFQFVPHNVISTVRPHGVFMCKAPQKRLHISICRLKWSTHPSPLAFLLIKKFVLLYVCYGICTVHAMYK